MTMIETSLPKAIEIAFNSMQVSALLALSRNQTPGYINQSLHNYLSAVGKESGYVIISHL